jgi:acyl dehydratase
MQLSINKCDISTISDRELGETEWLLIDQQLINRFADDTFDHQYIHVDTERASKTPFGTTIAHGMLVLSLIPHFLEQKGVNIEGAQMVMNYGFDKVRFINPVPSGSEVRGKLMVLSADEKRPGQYQIRYGIEVEIKGASKPALIAELLVLVFA